MSISIHADFDSASLENAEIDGNQVVLTPVSYTFNDIPTGNWFYFRLEGAKGRTLEFSFDTTRYKLHGYKRENRCVWSMDQENWFPINDTSGEDEDYRFSLEIKDDALWLAHSVPYPMKRVHNQVAKWLTSPYVSPSPSSDENGQILAENNKAWESDGGVSKTGLYIAPQPIYALSIADTDLDTTAPAVVVFGGNHPGEHCANFVIDGLMKAWLSEEPFAKQLRHTCRLIVYPMVNPDGRFGGFVRGCPSIPQGDHNRMWSSDDRGSLPNIDRIKDALAKDTAGPVEIFLDSHNTERPNDAFMYVNTTMHKNLATGEILPLLARMKCDIPGFRFKMTESLLIAPGNTTCKSWAAAATDGPHAKYSYTLEPGLPPEDSITISMHYGRTLALGINDHFLATKNHLV